MEQKRREGLFQCSEVENHRADEHSRTALPRIAASGPGAAKHLERGRCSSGMGFWFLNLLSICHIGLAAVRAVRCRCAEQAVLWLNLGDGAGGGGHLPRLTPEADTVLDFVSQLPPPSWTGFFPQPGCLSRCDVGRVFSVEGRGPWERALFFVVSTQAPRLLSVTVV